MKWMLFRDLFPMPSVVVSLTLGLTGCSLLAGCSDKSAPATAPLSTQTGGPASFPAGGQPAASNAIDPNDPQAAGKTAFQVNGCGRCHTTGAPESGAMAGGPAGPPGGARMGGPTPGGGGPGGFMMGAKGPNLAKVGADPAHTVDWLMEHIRNPKSHKADSRMPIFAGSISDDNLKALAEYLASLK